MQFNQGRRDPTITGYKDKFSYRVFPSADLRNTSFDISSSVISKDRKVASYNEADLDYARYLAKWAAAGETGETGLSEPRKKGRRTVTIAEMEATGFYNLVAEVGLFPLLSPDLQSLTTLLYHQIVHGCYDPRTKIAELSVTDYSVNDKLYVYEEGQEVARGIYGQRLLRISCWDDIAGDEAQIEEYKTTKGRVYRFDNVRMTTSGFDVLEGSLSTQQNGKQHVEPIVRVHVVPAELLE